MGVCLFDGAHLGDREVILCMLFPATVFAHPKIEQERGFNPF
jgi:hypothetical protein